MLTLALTIKCDTIGDLLGLKLLHLEVDVYLPTSVLKFPQNDFTLNRSIPKALTSRFCFKMGHSKYN
jgi:hypothetical protein